MRLSFCLTLFAAVSFCAWAIASDETNQSSLEIEAWIQQLGSPRFQVRESATNRLLAAGDAVVEPLRAALDDADRERARRARFVLSTILDERDMNALVGVWDYVTVKLGGKEENTGGRLKIERKTISIRKATGKEPYGPMPFVIDATRTPRHLDFRYKDSLIRCLYELDGDTLTLCYSKDSSGARPTSIRSEPGSSARLHILRRATE